MRVSHLVLLLALNVGWSTLPTFASRLQDALNPAQFIFVRYGLALAALLVAWPWLPGRLPRGRDFWLTCLMGVIVFTVGHALQIAGIQRSRASDASILLALDPLVSSLGAALFLHEVIPTRRWAGFALAIAGVTGMSLWSGRGFPGLLANLFIVLSFVSEAVWSVMGKPLIRNWGIPKVAALALLAGTVMNGAVLTPNLAGNAAAIRALPPSAWLTLAFLGIVLTAFGYCAWYVVIRDVPVSVAAMTIYLQPVIGTLFAAVATGERLVAAHYLGGAVIIAGLALGIRDQPRQPVGVPER